MISKSNNKHTQVRESKEKDPMHNPFMYFYQICMCNHHLMEAHFHLRVKNIKDHCDWVFFVQNWDPIDR